MSEHAKTPQPDLAAEAQTLHQLMAQRFSCRGYLPDAVPDDVINAILDTARLTASWCNTQPWHMIVTRPGTTEPFRDALSKQAEIAKGVDSDLTFPAEYRNQYLARRRAAGFALYEAVGIERGDKEGRVCQAMENFRFFGAPHVGIVTTAADLGPYGAVDCGGFIANFLLAARAHGVATIPQAAIAQHSGFIHKYFDIPEDRSIVCGISFGYADMTHPANSFRTTRETVSDIYRFA